LDGPLLLPTSIFYMVRPQSTTKGGQAERSLVLVVFPPGKPSMFSSERPLERVLLLFPLFSADWMTQIVAGVLCISFLLSATRSFSPSFVVISSPYTDPLPTSTPRPSPFRSERLSCGVQERRMDVQAVALPLGSLP